MSLKLMELREPRLDAREPRLEAREPRLLLEETVRELADKLGTDETKHLHELRDKAFKTQSRWFFFPPTHYTDNKNTAWYRSTDFHELTKEKKSCCVFMSG